MIFMCNRDIFERYSSWIFDIENCNSLIVAYPLHHLSPAIKLHFVFILLFSESRPLSPPDPGPLLIR